MNKKARSHRDSDFYCRAFDATMEIFRLSASFPAEERYALTDQIRRSSRSVCANLAEAWRRRRYEAAFINKVSIAESEAAETQVWLEFAVNCNYLSKEVARQLYESYSGIIRTLVGMINHADSWIIAPRQMSESHTTYETDVGAHAQPPF